EQRKLHEMLEHHRHDAEKHMEELERKKQHMMEEHRRQMGERGDRVPPPEREAREHALHEHLEAMERAQDQIRETIEREQHQLQDRLEDIERQKHRLMEESPGPMPRHEEARRPEAEHDEHRPPVRRRGPEGEPPHRGSAGMDSLLGWLLGPRAREALGFSDDQVERIGDLVRHVREHVKEVWQGLRDKMNRAGPEAREHIAREMREQMTRRWAEHRRDVMERLGQILRPDQRQRLRGWLREHGPAERPGPREQEPPGRPHEDRPSGRKGPHHPADETQAPTHRLM
ncbi:MAG: hypothetical protein U9R68_04745, partial [Planctomycetota bacterium]|nr:hypothetical protein [Planctomycetota bacterium]